MLKIEESGNFYPYEKNDIITQNGSQKHPI